jgi:hypothetical protein
MLRLFDYFSVKMCSNQGCGNLLLPNGFPLELPNVAHLPQQDCMIKNMHHLGKKFETSFFKGKQKKSR